MRNGLKSFISKLFKYLFTISPGHIYGNYFCWGFAASFSLLHAFERRTLQLRWWHSLLQRDTKHHWVSLTLLCCFHQRGNFFSALFDGCLKYINKEKPKTDPRPGPLLNFNVKIIPKPGPRDVKKSGPVRHGLKCRALAFNSVEIMFATYCCGCIIVMAKSRLVFFRCIFKKKKTESYIRVNMVRNIWLTTHRYWNRNILSLLHKQIQLTFSRRSVKKDPHREPSISPLSFWTWNSVVYSRCTLLTQTENHIQTNQVSLFRW